MADKRLNTKSRSSDMFIKLIGLLCLIGSLLCIFIPESMDWIAGPLATLMYRNLRNTIPGSLLMVLPYFSVSLILFCAAVGLFKFKSSCDA